MEREQSFAHWLKQRRKALDLTQHDLARLIGCAVITIQQVEGERRRPSKQMAELLATHLGIPVGEREAFVRLARTHALVPRPAPLSQLSEPATPTNVPVPLTPLIGRAAEVAAICTCLERPDIHLMTLVGPPGVGKTRLSLQVASALCARFPDGVWFVALAAIRELHLVAPTITQVLGLTEAGRQPVIDRLKSALRAKRALLVLDNFEQIVVAAPLITELLAACPQVKVLTTSRMPLHVYGEHEFAVEPFPVPHHASNVALERLMDYAAVELFVARVRAFKSDFALTAENAPAITEICTRLDGLPLAIELAAARMRQFTPETFIVHLNRQGDNPFPLLNAGPHDLPARQQTLHNALTWSYALLDGPAQQLFRRMGVFVGGCTMAAVTAVCGCTHPDDLTILIDQSLVQQELRGQAEPRITMLEMIREYALVRLAECGERVLMEQTHATYCLEQAEDAQDETVWLDRFQAAHVNLQDAVTRRSGLEVWLDRVQADHDNLRAALRWSLAHDAASTGLRLCRALWWFWETHGYWSEARRWMEAILAAASDRSPHLRMQVLACIGSIAWKQGDYAKVTAVMTESLALSRALGATSMVAYALMILGVAARDQGNYTQAGSLLSESLALKRALGDPAPAVLMHLGQLALVQEDYSQSQRLGEECLEACQQAGDTFYPSIAFRVLGETALAQGEYTRARTLLRESVARSRNIRHRRAIAFALTAFAGAVASGRESLDDDVCTAARIWGAAEVLREEVGIFLPVAESTRYERAIARARIWVRPDEWAAAWDAGRAMSLEQAIAVALALPVAEM
jgi:predicted ATPase/transcriptional regulator with XRE-family HTH domain